MVSLEYGFKGLFIQLETRGIHIGHVVRKDLHPTFMSQCSGQDRIDTSIHTADSFRFREGQQPLCQLRSRDIGVTSSNGRLEMSQFLRKLRRLR